MRKEVVLPESGLLGEACSKGGRRRLREEPVPTRARLEEYAIFEDITRWKKNLNL